MLSCPAGPRGLRISLAFLKGDQLVSGGADGTLKVWSPQTRTCECTIEAHEDCRVWALATYDGKVVSGGGDGTVRVFEDVTAQDLSEERAKDAEREASATRRSGRLCNRATLFQRSNRR